MEGYGFLSFARKFGNKYGKKIVNTAVNTKNKYGKKLMNTAINTKSKYGKKIMNTAKKERINFAKTSGKKMLQKSALATGDLIGNKIADKITSLGNKPKNGEYENVNEKEEIIISPEKRQQNF